MTGMNFSNSKWGEEKLEGLFDPSNFESQENNKETNNNDSVITQEKINNSTDDTKVDIENVLTNKKPNIKLSDLPDDVLWELADKQLEEEKRLLLEEKLNSLKFNKNQKIEIWKVLCSLSDWHKKSDVFYYEWNNDFIWENNALIPIFIPARKSKYILDISYEIHEWIWNHQKDDEMPKRVDHVKVENIYWFEKWKVNIENLKIRSDFNQEIEWRNWIKQMIIKNILNDYKYNSNLESDNFEKVEITNPIRLSDEQRWLNDTLMLYTNVKNKGYSIINNLFNNFKHNHDIYFKNNYNKDKKLDLLELNWKKIKLYKDSIFIRNKNLIQASFLDENDWNEYTLSIYFNNIKLEVISIDLYNNSEKILDQNYLSSEFMDKVNTIKENNDFKVMLFEKIRNFEKTQELKNNK